MNEVASKKIEIEHEDESTPIFVRTTDPTALYVAQEGNLHILPLEAMNHFNQAAAHELADIRRQRLEKPYEGDDAYEYSYHYDDSED